MGMLGAQEFEVMRGKIHDQDFPAGFEQASSLRQHSARIVEIVQYLVDDHDIGRADGGIERSDVAQAHLRMGDARSAQVRARHRKHFAARIDANTAHIGRSQHFEHAPRAGTEVDQQVNNASAQFGQHRRLDGRFGHMQGFQQVPAFRHLGEIIGCKRLLLGPCLGLTGTVAAAVGIIWVNARRQPAREVRPLPLRRQPVIGPGPLGMTLHQARIGQELQVPRHARLALVEDFRKVLDRVVAIRQKREQA